MNPHNWADECKHLVGEKISSFDFQICKNLGTSCLYKTMSDIFLIQSKRGVFEHGNLTKYYNKEKSHFIYKECNE